MTQPTPLSRWMQAVEPGAIVAYRNEQPVTSDDVLTKVDAWRTALQHTNGTHFAVYLDDTVEFLAVLFALWSLQRVACVVGDNRLSTAQKLQARVSGFVGDFPRSVMVLPELTSLEIETFGALGGTIPNEMFDLKSNWRN